MLLEWFKALLYGLIEGITEWLPISSTGHLVLLSERLPFAFSQESGLIEAFWELFSVAVQLGAVCAVAWRYRERLFYSLFSREKGVRHSATDLWRYILLASLPAAVVGTLGDALLERLTGRDLDGWLFHPTVVAAMLVLYGVIFLFFERIEKRRAGQKKALWQMNAKTAIGVGAFQVLSLVPGTSRSGATMLGASLCGMERKSGAELSFFMALPIMLGASAVKLWNFLQWTAQETATVPPICWGLLLFGAAVAFFVSLTVLSFLISFVRTHSLALFGWYRILLGVAVILFGRF